MKYIVLIMFLISCNDQKKEKFIPLEKLSKYYKLYPEFYDERPKYTIEKNIKLINEEYFSRILIIDSNNFIFTKTVSYKPYALNTFQANQFVLDNILMFKFYKYVRYTSKTIFTYF